MPSTAKTTPKKLDPTVAIVIYIVGAVGLIIILGITFCILRRIRWRRARKYIKQQSKRSLPMGPVLTSQPPTAPWKWKEVKANIKAKQRGQEKPYPHQPRPSTAAQSRPQSAVSTIINGHHSSIDTMSIHGVTRPQSAGSNGAASASLGQPHKKMHGDRARVVAHTVKQERLQIRRDAKSAKRERKDRQKEIKKDLTAILEGQRLPGDEFPDETASSSTIGGASPAVTHVGPLRKESLLEIPSVSYLITQSPRDRGIQRSTGAKQLDIPQLSVLRGHRATASNLCTWEEEKASTSRGPPRSSGRPTSGRPSSGRPGNSPRHKQQCEVVVHHITDNRPDSDIESITSEDRNTTEL